MAGKIISRGIRIWLDGDEVEANVNAIRNEIRKLIREQNKMTIGAEDYVRTGKKIAHLNDVLKDHKKNIQTISKEYKSLGERIKDTWTKASDWINSNMALAGTFIASITGISLAFRKIAEDVADMDDIYSDVMKTTGMTRNEVLALNEDFKRLDTRTSREELNKIAEAGGRIGVSKENILDFTKAIDIANVSLGDSFTGGVEEIATNLGKLKTLFQETKDMQVEEAYLKIGSAINEIESSGASSAPNITNFTLRLGSLPDALKPAISETIALGAAFEESAIDAEISSRAYNIILKQASTNVEKFAKVMGVSVTEVEDLINTDPLEFFLQFSEGLKGMNATDVAKTLNYLGINADGANKAIGAAANNTDRFRELIEISNEAFEDGTSVVDEYNIKNYNLRAELDKARKAFKETALELGEKLNPALLKSTRGLTYLIKILVNLPKWLKENRGMLVSVTMMLSAYTIAVNKARITLLLKNAQLKIQNFLLVTNKATTIAAAGAQALFTGNVKRAAAAMRLFNKVTGINPYVLLGTAIAAVTATLYKLGESLDKASAYAKAMTKVNRQVADSTARERTELNLLISTARNETLSKETRAKAIKKLNDISPKYLGHLNEENIKTAEATEALNKYTKALMENAKQKAIADNIAELYSKKFKNESEIAELDFAIEEDKKKGFFKSNAISRHAWSTRKKMLERRNKRMDQQISIYESTVQKTGYTGDGTVEDDNEDPKPTFIPDDKEDKKEKEKNKLKDAEKEKVNKKLRELEIENYKELAKLKTDYINNDKKTEEQYNQELLDLQRDFLEKKKELLSEILKTTVDPEVQEDLKKQLESITNELLDMDVAFRNQVLDNITKENEEAQKLNKENAEKRKEILEKYGVDDLLSQKEAELAVIDEYERLGIITHEEALKIKAVLDQKYLRAELENRLEGYQQIASSVNTMFADLGGVMDSFNSAEEKRVERKYNKLIKAAGRNSRKVAKLEEQKEEEIAKIRAKSADKQFILTVAGIVASTAQAAINSFASAAEWGGPIAGGIAAAAATAYGLSQVAIAREQQKAAKEGYFMGGYTGGNNPREVRGYFPDGSPYHGGEFVVNNRGVSNPNIRPVLDAIDAAQRTGTVNTLSKGELVKALNVSTAPSAVQQVVASKTDPYVFNTISRLSETVERLSVQLDQGINAYATISGDRGIAKKLDEYNKMTKSARG